MRRKLRYAVTGAVMVGVLSVGAVAYACTPQNGETRVLGCGTSNGGPCGPTGWTTTVGISARSRNIDDSASPYYGNNWKLYASAVWCHTGNLWNLGGTGSPWLPKGSNPTKMIPGPLYTDYVATGNISSIIGSGTAAWTYTGGSYDICFNNGSGSVTGSNSSYPVTVTFTS